MSVILETSLGDVTIDLLTEERPRCCLNFLKLCKMKYYNFALFHSVQRNLVAQTGDPTYTGKGGESVFYHLYGEQAKYFEAETKPRITHRDRGVVSMVNNGKNQHGSQFFITLAKNLDYLDGVHTVFGEVAEGFEVLDKINEAYTDDMHRPYVDIRIYHTIILDDPFDDPSGLQIPDKSPEPTKEQLASVRIAPDEEIDDFKGKTNEEVEEMEKEKTAKKDAMLLEMVGDLPDQDVKPPDNVLFVCKLNPVTTEEDLEIIFSRFGEIASCEVIKDQKSGESLQYAFVEFESPDSCEKAYFKMDNVLIDDRRIHVDFSQSVSKYRWKGKGKGVEHIKSGGGDAKKDKRREASPVHRKSPKPRHTDHSPKSKHHDHSSKPRRNDPSPKSRQVERSPKHKKHKRVSRSRSKSLDRKKNGRSRRHSSSPEEPRKRRSRSTEKKKSKKKAKEESRSRSRSVEKRKKRKDRSPSDSPPKKKKSKSRRSPSPAKKSKRRSSSPKKSKSKRRSPSPSPPARRRKRDSSSDSSDDDRKKRHGHKSR